MENPKDLPSVSLSHVRNLPPYSGIYFAIADDQILYVGQSINLQERWKRHHKMDELRKVPSVRIHFMSFDSTLGSLDEQETAFIKLFNPPLNTGGLRKIDKPWPKHPPLLLFLVYLIFAAPAGLIGAWAYSIHDTSLFDGCTWFLIVATAFYVGGDFVWWIARIVYHGERTAK